MKYHARHLTFGPELNVWTKTPGDQVEIPIRTDGRGRPKPLLALSFDGTICSTICNWCEAIKRAALYYDSRADFTRFPAMAKFETGYIPLTPSGLSCVFGDVFGMSKDIQGGAFDLIKPFLLKAEERSPSVMFPGAKRLLEASLLLGMQPVIVTSNQAHDIQTMLACEMGDKEVDILQVEGLDKSGVLTLLAEHHQTALNARKELQTGKPMYFFGCTLQDVTSGAGCRNVRTVAVCRSKQDRRGLIGRFLWGGHIFKLGDLGAQRIVDHKEMAVVD